MILVGALISGIALKSYQMPSVVIRKSFEAPLVNENEFDAREIDRLKIDWAAGKIVIVPVEEKNISVTEELLGTDKTMVLKKTAPRCMCSIVKVPSACLSAPAPV